MSRGLQPVLDAIQADGCPACNEHLTAVQVNGPDDIRLSCGHVINAKDWADEQYEP